MNAQASRMPRIAPFEDETRDHAGERQQPEPPAARADPVADQVAPTAPAPAPKGRGRNFLRVFLMLVGIAGLAIGGGYYWLLGGRWIETDDAYIRAPKLMVSTDISGIVASVDVAEGQRVKAGDILFRVDPRQFEIALAAARAQMDNIRVSLTAARLDYAQLKAGIAAQEAQVALAQIVNDRAAELMKTNAGTKVAYDQARFGLEAARKQLDALRRQAEAALVRMGGRDDTPVEQLPQYIEAQARVDEAARQLDHALVRAPFDGIVTAVDKLQPGTYLVSQTAALTNTGAVALVATDGLYVEANIKETDLTFIKVGDAAEVRVDAYPDRVWKATVDSISPASGSEFAIIPSQNASGNWVKVVQRVPLRLKLAQSADDPRLRAGMSVVANIDTGHKRRPEELWSWLPFLDQAKAHAAGRP